MTVYHWSRLELCDPDLVRLAYDVGLSRDVDVSQGARSLADEQADILAGRSHLKNPADSKHVIVPGVRLVAEAIDLTPHPVDWNDHQSFVDLAAFVKERALALGINNLVWGGAWDGTPNRPGQLMDLDHFQLGA